MTEQAPLGVPNDANTEKTGTGAPPAGNDSLYNRVAAEAGLEPPQAATQTQDKPVIGKYGATNLGAIAELSTPADWDLSKSENTALGYVHRWSPKGRSDISISVDSRAAALNTADAKAFQDLLQLPVGTVLTPEQIQGAQGALRDKADPSVFKVESAVIQEIDGQRVVAIKGEYPKDKVSAEAVFFRSSADASYTQQIAYTAPTKDYAKFGGGPGKSLDALQLR